MKNYSTIIPWDVALFLNIDLCGKMQGERILERILRMRIGLVIGALNTPTNVREMLDSLFANNKTYNQNKNENENSNNEET